MRRLSAILVLFSIVVLVDMLSTSDSYIKGYKQGQVDVLSGSVHYQRVVLGDSLTRDSLVVWDTLLDTCAVSVQDTSKVKSGFMFITYMGDTIR